MHDSFRLFVYGLLLLLIWIAQSDSIFAQSVTISGYVEDETNGERITGVSIYAADLKTGTTTNQYGFYTLTSDPAPSLLWISHIGYEPISNPLVVTRDTILTFNLVPRVLKLGDLQVVAERETELDNIQMSRHVIPIEEIETLPVILGEIDVQKTLQLLPGVQSGIEGSSGLYVRGGRADQNMILLDGLHIYNPNHLFGFFSVFNSSAMRQVELIKGGFPARYGGRLSSVVNYSMKEGNLKRFEGEGALGIISSRLVLEGPIVKDRASFLIAGRETFSDELMKLYYNGQTDQNSAGFYDLNLKTNFILSQRNRIYLSAYAGQDKFSFLRKPFPGSEEIENSYRLGWQNRLASLRWNRVIGDRLFASALIGITHYRFNSNTQFIDIEDGESIEFNQTWFSGIDDWTAKIDFEYLPNTQHFLRFGTQAILHRFTPGSTQTLFDQSGKPPVNLLQTPSGAIRSREMSFYAEDEIQLLPSVKISTGLRFSMYYTSDKRFQSFEPRLSTNVRIAENTVAKASYVRSKQYVHLLTGGGSAFPTDLWIPSINGIPPQSGYQFAAGLVQNYQDGHYQFSMEGYYKRMKGHIDYSFGSDRFQSALLDWPDLIESGSGSSRGLEMLIRKKGGPLSGWIGYTWAKTTRRYDLLNNGIPFPDGFDRRHDISLVMQYQLSDAIHLSAVWVYGSGYPVWVHQGRYIVEPRPESGFNYSYNALEPGPVNSARAPIYHRLDFSIYFTKQKSWAERTITIGVYNAYNRKNPMFIYPDEYFTSGDFTLIQYEQLSLLQLIPSISWQYIF
ncbi:MAG: TonB-dependent receptor [Bacteroidetes bacterium]|nr:TonB-dependent receptor [Bacteroidota bacterium]